MNLNYFDVLSLLDAAALLVVAYQVRITDMVRYRAALTYFIAASVLYYPVSELFAIGVYASFVTRPVGFILVLMSIRALCLSILNPPQKSEG